MNIPSAETRSADADVTCCCFLCAAEPEAGAKSELLSDHFLFYDLHGCVCVQSLIYSQQTRFYKGAHPQTHMIYFALWLEIFFNHLQSCKTFEYLVSPVNAYKAEHLHRRYAQSTHRRIGAGFILLLKETRYISAEFCTDL